MTARTEIRKAFAGLLTGLPTCGARVFVARTRRLSDADLPAILVFSGTHTPADTGPGPQRADISAYRLRADIVVKHADGAEDIADSALEEIEGAVFASVSANTLGGLVHATRLVQAGEPDLDDGLEKPVLRLPVLFETLFSQE